MPGYSVHWDVTGECHNCMEQTGYLFHSDWLVDGGLDWPVSVAVWVCEDCLSVYGNQRPAVWSDWIIWEAARRSEGPFTEWRPKQAPKSK